MSEADVKHFVDAMDDIAASGNRVSAAFKLTAEVVRELTLTMRPWLRRMTNPRHGFTGNRHRGTAKWKRRYAHRT